MFTNKDGKVRSGWKIAAVTGVIFGITIFLTIIISFIPMVMIFMNGNINFKTMEFTENGKRLFNILNLIGMFIQEIVMILTPIITWRFILKRPLSNMGLGSIKSHWKELITGLLFGIVSITIVFALIVLSGNGRVNSWALHFSPDTVIYLALFILVGFAEEIYGRGFIMSCLRQTRSIPVVVIVSSLIFAALHSLNSGISLIAYLNLTLVGVLFAFMYLKSGNIWMPIGYHIMWNYFQGNVFGFKVSGINTQGLLTTSYEKNNIFNGGKFGPEGGLFVTIILLAGFIFVYGYYRKKNFDFIASEPAAQPKYPFH